MAALADLVNFQLQNAKALSDLLSSEKPLSPAENQMILNE